MESHLSYSGLITGDDDDANKFVHFEAREHSGFNETAAREGRCAGVWLAEFACVHLHVHLLFCVLVRSLTGR